MPAYAYLNRILNMYQVPNTPKFWIWQGSQYLNVTRRFEYARIYASECISGSKYARALNMQELDRDTQYD